ncbi:ImpJ/VasE [Acidisarcina polymorpha]|uniref:ImpJ/VasE n=1 Tax=Acidisarcina polymorpha TaxID=2211140 RepID=A0A2Z5G2D6_9BACT|nr:ImpJ/VasE [Acidisarcina polymorpha]
MVWSEGMYLAPHHFQTQSRYFEDSIAFLASSLWREPWGLLHLEMDAKAIANGSVSMLVGSGIFQDGLAFDMPSSDALPAIRELSSFAKATDSELILHLAVQVRRNDGYDASWDDPQRRPRYSSIPRTLRDETNGIDEYEVQLAHKNIFIASEAELSPELLSFPIARIVRDASGQFTYDLEFVPCSLRTNASDALMLQLKRIINIVAEKAKTIARPVHAANQLKTGSVPMEIASYWFLHALHSSLPSLRHLVYTRHAHPADCFVELSRLAGALCTFALDSDPQSLPNYDHHNSGAGFRALCAHIQRHLEIIVPTNTVDLEFSPSSPYIHTAPVTDERCLRRSRWVLGIRTALGESEQLRLVPRLVKVCSARFVPELVKRALPGMTLTHLPVPPSALRTSVDMQYYAIDTAGPCWQHILQTRSVGIYIPGEIDDPEFTLSIILEQPA